MKKLLALLLLMPLLFVACGDEDEPTPPPYFNPVEGEWVYTLAQYNYTETWVFTKEFDALAISVNNGNKTIVDIGKYSININLITYTKSTHEYKIVKDTLWFWVKGKEPDWNEKFIRKR